MARPEETLEDHYVDAFERNLGMQPQQRMSRLVSRVDSDENFTKTGDRFNADDLGTSDPEDIEERIPNTPDGFVERKRRVGFLTPYHDAKWLDDVDEAKSLSDASSGVMQAMQAGHERKKDKEIVRAALASAREGRTGEDTIAFDTTNRRIAVDSHDYYSLSMTTAPTGDAGLTLSKLIEGKTKLDAAEVDDDMGEATWVCSADDIGQLLRDPHLTSSDFAVVRALQAGEINSFMGFTFVRYNALPVTAGVRSNIAFRKKALVYKRRQLTTARIGQRADKSYNWQAYYKGIHGAARRYDEGVLEVLCKVTT